MRATLDFTDDLNGSDLDELAEAAREDGRSVAKLLKEAAMHLVKSRREMPALVSKDGKATTVTEQG